MDRAIQAIPTEKLLLIAGFVSLSIATWSAYLTPARGFELSIYSETPRLFWIGFGTSLFISIIVAFSTTDRTTRYITFGLGGLSFTNFVFLPPIRSWEYMSKADGLTHLGAVKEIETGFLSLLELGYPAIYGLNIYISKFTGFDLKHSFLIVIGIFVLIFIIFVPLTARLISNTKQVVTIAVFSGFLLLPINPAAVRLEPHPSTQAIFFTVIVMYLVLFGFLYQMRQVTLLLTVVMFTVVILHPQQAANILSLLVVIAVVQSVHSWKSDKEVVSLTWPIYNQVTVLGMFFWIWVNANLTTLFEVGVSRAFGIIFGVRNDIAAESVQTRSISLDAVGGSVEVLFLKIFLVSAIYCIVSGLLMGTSVLGLLGSRAKKLYHSFEFILDLSSPAIVIVAYWTIGFIAPFILFVVYLVGGITDQYFRHFGFLMVTATILGAVAFGQLMENLRSFFSVKILSTVMIIVVVLFLLASIPVAFESPYVYQHSHHVTEAEMNGMEITLENTANEMPRTMLRTGVNRYEDAIYGTNPRNRAEGTNPARVPDRFADRPLTGVDNEERHYRNLPGFFNQTAYLFITEENRQLETSVYNGFRWSKQDFRYLEREPEINRIHDNGELTLYIIHPGERR